LSYIKITSVYIRVTAHVQSNLLADTFHDEQQGVCKLTVNVTMTHMHIIRTATNGHRNL